MGNSEASNAEGAEMQAVHDDNERASEQDNYESESAARDQSAALDEPTNPPRPVDPPRQADPPRPVDPPRQVDPPPRQVDPPQPAAPDDSRYETSKRASKKPRARSRSGIEPNNVRKLRQEAMMSKAELARRAGVSPLTIDRVEAGCPCRMDTKRKILEALGLKPSARTEVWPDIDAQS